VEWKSGDTSPQPPRRHWHYYRQHGVTPRVAIEVNSISAVIEIVRRTPLATLLPAAIAHENGELHGIRLEPALPQRTAALLQRKGAYRSAATSAFVALALEECQVRETTHQTRSTK
jgi:LysR family cyn operon transcriptional activator